MLRQIAIILAGALSLSGCGGPDPFEDHEWSQPSPALWQVTAPSGEEGWLFGTIHALPDGLDWQTEQADAAFANAGTLLVEIAELGDAELAADRFNERANSPGLPPLLDRVSPQERPALQQLLTFAQQDEDDFADTESWAAALLLAGSMRSGEPENGVDRMLITSARADDKPVIGLEGFAAQYQLFDSLPEAEQLDLLLAIAKEAQNYDPVKPVEAWLTGDLAQLEEIGRNGLLADPELRAALLDQRNRDWLAEIRQNIVAGNEPFIAVGAAHMLGQNGLPALLEADGFVVTRLE